MFVQAGGGGGAKRCFGGLEIPIDFEKIKFHDY